MRRVCKVICFIIRCLLERKCYFDIQAALDSARDLGKWWQPATPVAPGPVRFKLMDELECSAGRWRGVHGTGRQAKYL